MVYNILSFTLGFVGGIIGFAVIYLSFEWYFKDYFYNKEHYKTRMKVKKLIEEVTSLKIQVARLNAEAYFQVVDEKYK